MYKNDDTICAPATVPGTGAITIIRVSGNDAFALTDRVVAFKSGNCASAKGYTLKFGSVRGRDGMELDEVLVGVFRGPKSYTGEDSTEIYCHASPFIASELMNLLCEAGARPAGPGEFTRRAYLNGRMDLAQAEAVADVVASNSAASNRIALKQMKGS
ncbi:MAG: tRNA uridine-5-carboxymethylaminomethyl(34) synthesis GTPase MnmE, partial [Bacteroidales bacterium]|nr:tRNA uridine-5-carboxymethylaminomethyl(34) synthesis GTPase MnmE [Bacteroidales bacterium]